MRTTCGLAKACNVLASPLNKNIFVVRLGRKVFKFDGRQEAVTVDGLKSFTYEKNNLLSDIFSFIKLEV